MRLASLSLPAPNRALVFFFFQAEDGIRDVAVTGVQTCALPIWWPDSPRLARVRQQRARAMRPLVALEVCALEVFPGEAQTERRRRIDLDERVVANAQRAHASERAVGKIGRASCRERVEISVAAG